MEDIKFTTQEHLDIETITNDLVVLKNGAAVLIIRTNAVNFDLLSEIEQDAIIAAFSGLLNSLNFPVQIIVRSKKLDITNYLEKVKAIENRIKDPLLKVQAEAYRKFVQELIKRNEVLDKSFYVSIPSGGTASTPTGSPFDFLSALTGTKKATKRVNVDVPKLLKTATNELYPKRDTLTREFARINIKAKQLTTQELVELFFDIYNPVSLHDQRMRTNADDYRIPIVEPAILEE
ncbi:MAG: hypothetical protein AAB443_01530 [Patescibacteria group bacterium]